VFKSPFGAKREKQTGITGSGPYIAPEEYSRGEYDSELVDVWACGIIAYVMTTNSIPWRAAEIGDTRYRLYTETSKKFSPFERVHPGLRKLLYKILEPEPTARMTITEILEDEWVKNIEVCTPGNLHTVNHQHTSHGNNDI
jgi:serine/threonine protein kinase